MDNFENFSVISFRSYSDADYTRYDDSLFDYLTKSPDINYHSVFHRPTSRFIYFEYIIVNKLYGIDDWDLELDFEIDLSGRISDSGPLYSDNVKLLISRSEKEVLIKEEVEFSKFCCWSDFMSDFDASFRYKDDHAGLLEFTVITTEYAIGKRNPFFQISDFHLYSEDSEQIQTVFNRNNTSIKIQFEIDTYFNDEVICREDAEFIKYELLFALTDRSGRINRKHLHEAEMFRNENVTIDIEPPDDFFDLKEKGRYKLSVIFFGKKIDCCDFRIDNYDEVTDEGDSRPYKIIFPDSDAENTGKDIFSELDKMHGIYNIKDEIRSIVSMIALRKEKDGLFGTLSKKPRVHFTFSGNPGTGKSRLAEILCGIFVSSGYLNRSIVTLMDKFSINGKPQDKAEKTRNILSTAKGGILMIENADEILSDSGVYSLGKEAVNILMNKITKGTADTIIIASGHTEKMKYFLKSRPDMARKFRNNFVFPDYTSDELLKICKMKANEMKYTISDEAEMYIEENLDRIITDGINHFRNASGAVEIIDSAESNFTKRIIGDKSIADVGPIPLKLEKEDFEGVFDRYLISSRAVIRTNKIALEDALTELNRLTGITEIRKSISDLAKRCRYYNEEKIVKNISLHSAFTGNPGTGKTTVARILAKIYKALGLLENGHLVECDRASLVGEYVGHTAAKTEKLIEEAMGGVLFIDEAYSLAVDNRDFGREAIEILLKRMEDHRGKFAVICAGYSEEMDKFLKSNPGLKSRFDMIYEFPDYSPDELYKIATDRFDELGLDYSGVSDKLAEIIGKLCRGRDRYFGNAREIRTLTDMISAKHDLRLAEIPKSKRTAKIKNTLTEEDLDTGLRFKDDDEEKPKIGFTF